MQRAGALRDLAVCGHGGDGGVCDLGARERVDVGQHLGGGVLSSPQLAVRRAVRDDDARRGADTDGEQRGRCWRGVQHVAGVRRERLELLLQRAVRVRGGDRLGHGVGVPRRLEQPLLPSDARRRRRVVAGGRARGAPRVGVGAQHDAAVVVVGAAVLRRVVGRRGVQLDCRFAAIASVSAAAASASVVFAAVPAASVSATVSAASFAPSRATAKSPASFAPSPFAPSPFATSAVAAATLSRALPGQPCRPFPGRIRRWREVRLRPTVHDAYGPRLQPCHPRLEPIRRLSILALCCGYPRGRQHKQQPQLDCRREGVGPLRPRRRSEPRPRRDRPLSTRADGRPLRRRRLQRTGQRHVRHVLQLQCHRVPVAAGLEHERRRRALPGERQHVRPRRHEREVLAAPLPVRGGQRHGVATVHLLGAIPLDRLRAVAATVAAAPLAASRRRARRLHQLAQLSRRHPPKVGQLRLPAGCVGLWVPDRTRRDDGR